MTASAQISQSHEDRPASAWQESELQSARRSVLELVDELSVDELVELLSAWVEDASRETAEIVRLAEGPNQDALRIAAHSFKGNCNLFGLSRLAALSEQIEDSARARQLTEQTPVARELDREFRSISPSLLQLITELNHPPPPNCQQEL